MTLKSLTASLTAALQQGHQAALKQADTIDRTQHHWTMTSPCIQEQYPGFRILTGQTHRYPHCLSRLVLPSYLLIEIMSGGQLECRNASMDRHSLEAWGYQTEVLSRVTLASHESNDWSTYTPEMLDYCKQDTLVTLRLYELLQRRMNDYE